jgi:hypothetical protein
MIGTQTVNAAGVAVALPSPVQFGILQDVTIDETYEQKKLYGALKQPVAVGQGKGSYGIKAKLALINAELFNTFMYGVNLVQTYEALYNDLTGTIIGPTAGGTAIITPTLFGTALADMGVVSAVNGVPYTRVASAPTSGQYAWSSGSGAWIFDLVHDFGKQVYINYAYGNPGAGVPTGLTGAKSMTIIGSQMGQQPEFMLDLQNSFNGKTFYRHYNRVIAAKISRAFKNDDFTIIDLEMEAFLDDTNTLFTDYYYE